MANLKPLIRVRKHAVEQKQKALAALYRRAEELDTQKKTLLEELTNERKNLNGLAVDYMVFFSKYEQSVKDRVEEITQARKALETHIENAREDMRQAFAELKKVEITQENRDKAENAAITRKETIAMDDIAIDRFRRAKEE